MYFRGDTKENKITLTFDDGPASETEQVLDVLKKYEIKATFFVVGSMIKGREHILDRIKKEGHAIGNHTYSHRRLWFKSRKFIKKEIDMCDEELLKNGITTEFFRFPGFRYGMNGLVVARKLKKKVIFGTLFYDWVSRDFLNPWLKKRTSIHGEEKIQKVIKRVLRKTKKGAILVFHDYLQEIGPNTEIAEILERVLPKLKEKYTFTTLEELVS